MAANAQEASASTVNCTICFEDVSDTCGRTVVKLQCSHSFHLDCIGSAFNIKGAMECPNCRGVENGVWRRFEFGFPELNIGQETDDEDAEHGIEMQTLEDHGCPFHGWVLGLSSPGYPHVMEQHAIFASNPNSNNQFYHPPVPSEISASQVLHNTDHHHHHCDTNQALVPSTTLRISQGDVDGIPTLESVAHQVTLDQGVHDQMPVDSSIGLAYQSNNDPVYRSFHWMQPPSNLPSPVVRASMSSGMRRSNEFRGWLPSGHAASSLEETVNSYLEPFDNLANQNPRQAADLLQTLQERIDIEISHVQERIDSDLEFFCDDLFLEM